LEGVPREIGLFATSTEVDFTSDSPRRAKAAGAISTTAAIKPRSLMRFISKYPKYKFIAIHEQVEILASGLPRTTAPGFICEFKTFDTTDWERDFARRTFKYNGVPFSESGVLIDPTVSRISSYDTSEIPNPQLRKKVEKRLLETCRPDDHILVEDPKHQTPVEAEEEVVAA
jgi:hypothetical protein